MYIKVASIIVKLISYSRCRCRIVITNFMFFINPRNHMNLFAKFKFIEQTSPLVIPREATVGISWFCVCIRTTSQEIATPSARNDEVAW